MIVWQLKSEKEVFMSIWNSFAVPALTLSLIAGSLCGGSIGCGGSGPRAVRGSDVAGLDDAAFGTGLDRRDLEKMLDENLDSLRASTMGTLWKQQGRPTLAVLAMRNETSEHIDSALGALITKVETYLVNGGDVRVISRESQPEMIAEIETQQSAAFNASTVSKTARQAGVRYFFTGKVHSIDELQVGERRVQYFLAMRIIDVETSETVWMNSADVTKAIVVD